MENLEKEISTANIFSVIVLTLFDFKFKLQYRFYEKKFKEGELFKSCFENRNSCIFIKLQIMEAMYNVSTLKDFALQVMEKKRQHLSYALCIKHL